MHPLLKVAYVAPRTEVEQTIAAIWQEVLSLEKVGTNDNFFRIGGTSLLATQIISRINEAFQIDLSPRSFFEERTVAGLSQVIEKLRNSDAAFQVPRIAPISREARRLKLSPLSFAQQRLWFLDQLEPESPLYNLPQAFRMSGALNVGALRQTFDAIVSRHESLRTTFPMVDEHPMQCIAEKGSISMPVIDLTGLPEAEREGEARRLAVEEFRRPFDLAKGPLLRVNLLRLGDKEHLLLLTMHHIVSDGWSTEIMVREIATLFEALSRGTIPSLPELPIQYADFAEWQREWLQGEVLEAQASYWKKQLGGNRPMMELPTDRPLPAMQTYRGKIKSLILSKTLHEALKALSQREGVTLFMTLLAAFQTLLHRYTGQDDITVGSPIANRNRREIEGLIGFFVNTLVLRSDLSGNPTFRELLVRVREVALGAYDHQDLPFEKLVEELQPERNFTHNPLFNVWVNFTNIPLNSFESSGITFSPLDIFEPIAQWPIALYVFQERDSLSLRLLYQVELYSEERMSILLEQFHHLLRQIAASADERICSYSLITPGTSLLLPDPSAFLTEPQQEPVTSMFSYWAKKTPENPAVTQNKQLWTYSELAERSDTLEQALRRVGQQRKDVVAILGSRSFGLIAGMIGVLKSGSVLLLIDENLPKARQTLMLREADAKTLLYVGDIRAQNSGFENEISLNILYVDPATGYLKEVRKDPSPKKSNSAETLPEDAAYIFFTSGTTGVPKGVLGSHRGLSHFLNWQRETFGVGPHDRCAQLTGLSFDVVLRDIFLPLTSGATICLPDDDLLLDPNSILPWLDRERISLLHTVPTLAHSWLADVSVGVSLRSLRCVFFAGEPLTDSLVRLWRTVFPKGEVINLYGPTETTLAKCFYRVPATISPGVQPLGRPLPQTQVLVLGANLHLCGIGEPGEITIRTPFRSLGYINAPEESRKRFSKNPFRSDETDLVYFTGDRGRYRPDGSLEFLGRLDNQVKIRGVRIELGEIESVLGQREAVREVVVMAREDVPGDKRLVAYLVPNEKQAPSVSVLRQFLMEKLPEYMVPNAFVMLEKFPLTPNGKVDRRALPAPEHTRPELEETYVAPRTPVQQSLAEIWADVLGVERVGVNDNFFHLGGHSLLAVQLFVRIRKWAGIDLPLAILFRSPTVRALAELLDPSGATAPISGETRFEIPSLVQHWRSLVPIQPEGNRPPVFLIHAVGGNLLYYFSLLPHLGPDQPVYGLQARGVDGVLSPHSSIEEMASHYIAEIRSVQSSGPYFLGGASFGGTVVFEIAQQLTQQGEKIAFLALLDSIGPGARGYRYSRSSVRMRLSRVQGDIIAQQVPLPAYLSKRICRYLSNRLRNLRLGFTRMTKRPIPLELREAYLYRSHYKALKRYLPHRYFGPIILFRGPAGNKWPHNDPELGWKDIARGGLTIIIIPARHHAFVESAELGAQFSENLKEAQDKVNKSGLAFNHFPQNESAGFLRGQGERSGLPSVS
jgi:amino acid adenylation domain-containing protein